jgi:asparagine synthase (glutamine-hydrolysing)
MCGIAGFTGYKEDARTLIFSMLGEIEHRGPDDDGILVDRDTAIGMRRLSIIDVAHGKQPITTQDGVFSILYNGEIYNYAELRKELETLGARFITNSDTEAILIGYQVWGVDCLNRLRGMFACAIYDHRDGSLFVARDRIGIKPLYYAIIDNKFIFASEIKALLKHPAIAKEVNPLAIDDYLSLRYVPGPQTLFKNIKKFPPAHFMIWKSSGGQFKRYWNPDNIQGTTLNKSEAQDKFDDLLDEATRLHMVSERPVGAFLSGGLDSTAIVASLSRQFQSGLKTFSVGFGWQGDELSTAARTAKAMGCDHHEIICRKEDTSLLGKIVWNLDEPVGDGIVLPMYLLSQNASTHVKVVQSGEGADEILGGYFMHRVMKWAALYSRHIPSLMQKKAIAPMVKAMPSSLLNMLFDYPGELGEAGKQRLLGFLDVLSRPSTSEQYRFFISLFSEKEKTCFYSEGFGNTLSKAHETRKESALLDFNKMLSLQFEHWLPDDILCKLDKITMAHSLEGRVPFMDHKLVEFVMSVSMEYKISVRQNKIPLRNYLTRHYSHSFAKRKKVPFYIPIDQYLASDPLKSIVNELLSEKSVKNRGLFRWEAVRNLREASGQKGFLFGKQIFSLTMLELWHRIFIDGEKGWTA